MAHSQSQVPIVFYHDELLDVEQLNLRNLFNRPILRGDPIPQGDHKDVVSRTAASDAETALNSSFALRGIRPVTLSHCSASFCTTVRLGILV